MHKRVRLVGLTSDALNGEVGMRGAYDMASGRFVVKLDRDGKEISVKDENMTDE